MLYADEILGVDITHVDANAHKEGVLEGLRAGGAASKGPASSFQSHSKANRGTRPAPSTTPDVTSDAA